MSAMQLQSLPVVLFRHAGQCFAIEAQYVSRQGLVDDLQDLAVISFAGLLSPGKPTTEPAIAWLELRSSQARRWRLSLQASAELIELPADCIYALPTSLQVRRQFSAVQALAFYQNELVAILDVRALQHLADTLIQELDS